MPFLTGKEEKGRRDWFAYWSDDGDLLAFRKDRWKFHYQIQENETGWAVWERPFTKLRVPKLFDLKMDPFERGDTSDFYGPWQYDRQFLITGIALPETAKMLQTFKEFPVRQKPASFTIGIEK
ncbi:sulfatase domain protein [Vibrio parahaemolyticus VPTS-2010_2]|nr:sulfatase domain protein [Vibrio parahaemolyticus VPTS-2010_2]